MATETKPTHAYIGVDPCGCVRAITVDTPDHPKEVRRDVREFMKHGHVERMPLEPVNPGHLLCFAKHPKKKGCPHPQNCPEWGKYRERLTQAPTPQPARSEGPDAESRS